jgi:DNA-binding LacI/PurR family transcriptional regulator
MTQSPPLSVDTIAEELRQQIEQLAEGTKLPTVRSMMQSFGVGQAIVQQAIERLEVDGLVRAEVGRGTFVRRTTRSVPGRWSIVILNHERPGRRGEDITSNLHEQLLAAGHRSVVITYSDLAHAADLVRSMPSTDACVIRPQSDVLPASILATIQSKCRAVVVEGVPVEQVDVDSVVTDWLLTLETALRHLRARGHTKVGLVLDRHDSCYARDGARFFKSLMGVAGAEDAPVVRGGDDGSYDLSPLSGCTAVIAWCAFVVAAIRTAGLTLPIVAIENLDLADPALAGLTVVGRRADRIAAAVVDRIGRRLDNPAAPFAPVYDEPTLVVAD